MAAIALGENAVAGVTQLGGELADDLLEYVLQGDNAHHVAIFIHHNGQTQLVALEVQQLGVQRRALGDEVGWVHLPFQRGAIEALAVEDPAQIAHVQHADNIVDVVAPHRQAGVRAGLQGAQDGVVVLVEIDAEDLVARHHHVVHRHFLEVEDIQQHAPVRRGNQRPGLVDDGAQLLGGQVFLLPRCRVGAEQAHQAIGDKIHRPDHRVHDLHQRQQDHAGGKGNTLRAQGGQGLGGDLGEDQDHQGQGDGRNGNAGVAPQADGQDGGDGGSENVDQVIADQDQSDQAIRSLQQFAGPAGTPMLLLTQVLQPVAVEGHHCRFRAGKERGKEDEKDQN